MGITWHSSRGEMECVCSLIPLLYCKPHALQSRNRMGGGDRLHFGVFVLPQRAQILGSDFRERRASYFHTPILNLQVSERLQNYLLKEWREGRQKGSRAACILRPHQYLGWSDWSWAPVGSLHPSTGWGSLDSLLSAGIGREMDYRSLGSALSLWWIPDRKKTQIVVIATVGANPLFSVFCGLLLLDWVIKGRQVGHWAGVRIPIRLCISGTGNERSIKHRNGIGSRKRQFRVGITRLLIVWLNHRCSHIPNPTTRERAMCSFRFLEICSKRKRGMSADGQRPF